MPLRAPSTQTIFQSFQLTRGDRTRQRQAKSRSTFLHGWRTYRSYRKSLRLQKFGSGERFAGATLRESLVGSGLPEPAATRYAETIKDGGALIAADVEDDDVEQVLEVMSAHVQDVEDGAGS